MPDTHALLSPSSAKIWMTCPQAARASAGMPDRGSAFSEEGTVAHDLAQHVLTMAWVEGVVCMYTAADIRQRIADNPDLGQLREQCAAAGGDWDEMLSHVVEDYCTLVYGQWVEAHLYDEEARLLVESNVDLSRYIPHGFGRADAVIVYTDPSGNGVLSVFDLKYGRGVRVSAELNPQMMCYALGVLTGEAKDCAVDLVKMTICQPRLGNTSCYEMRSDVLMWWGSSVLRPAAVRAYNGDGQRQPGMHCQFCRARVRCRAALMYSELAMVAFSAVDGLTDSELGDVLSILPVVENWCAKMRSETLALMMEGRTIPGYKVVEGRSTSRVADADGLLRALTEAGYDRQALLKDPELRSLTDIRKLIGTASYREYVAPYVTRMPGKPTIAEADDARPAMVSNAEDDFRNITQ